MKFERKQKGLVRLHKKILLHFANQIKQNVTYYCSFYFTLHVLLTCLQFYYFNLSGDLYFSSIFVTYISLDDS